MVDGYLDRRVRTFDTSTGQGVNVGHSEFGVSACAADVGGLGVCYDEYKVWWGHFLALGKTMFIARRGLSNPRIW